MAAPLSSSRPGVLGAAAAPPRDALFTQPESHFCAHRRHPRARLPPASLFVDVDGSAALEQVQGLAGALGAPGALPALEVLQLSPTAGWRAGMLPLLAGALTSGTAPTLRVLDLVRGPQADWDLEALVGMLEARAQLPACRGLEQLKAPGLLDPSRSEALRKRLLRALLPSITEMEGPLNWCAAYDECFTAAPAPHLVTINIYGMQGARLPSSLALEAMPALENFELDCGVLHDAAEMMNGQAVITALRRGAAFRHLQSLTLERLRLAPAQWGPPAQCPGRGRLRNAADFPAASYNQCGPSFHAHPLRPFGPGALSPAATALVGQ